MRNLRHCGTVRVLLIAAVLCVHATAGSAGQTSRYLFLSDQSTVIQTGGFAGVHWTYRIDGQFLLTVDPNAATASFAQVDANATDDSEYRRTLDPNEVFNMTSLAGTVLDATTISFTGKAPDGSSIDMRVTLQEGSAHLVGQTTPPPGTADFFVFALDATAHRKYAGGTGTAEDPYQIATAGDLIALGETPVDYDKYFKLMTDIDLSGFDGKEGRPAFHVIGDCYRWTNGIESFVGGTPFKGVFDGNGKTISHLMTLKGNGNLRGLFGGVGPRGLVRNLRVWWMST